MLVSHRCKFIVFRDPMGSCAWVDRVLDPWLDHPVADRQNTAPQSLLFQGMTPQEAALAFDLMGYDFRSYTKIAIIENPFKRMARLYDRIAATDRVWRLRRRIGGADPGFGRWLAQTKPHGHGAGTWTGPRWRRFGAWSADAWSGGYIDHYVRTNAPKPDLQRIFRNLDIAPVIAPRMRATDDKQFAEILRYDAESAALIRQRYRSDLRVFQSPDRPLYLAA